MSPTEFFYTVVDAQLTFIPGDDGKAKQVILHQNGQDMPAKRQ
jgi:serine-type D-Ala-D-Ala carboxypeptidase/endopeptidase